MGHSDGMFGACITFRGYCMSLECIKPINYLIDSEFVSLSINYLFFAVTFHNWPDTMSVHYSIWPNMVRNWSDMVIEHCKQSVLHLNE